MRPERPIQELAQEMAETCLAEHARTLSRLISGRYEAMAEPLGLTVARVLLLGAVARRGKASPADLAERLGFDPSTLSRNFKAMREEGLVEMAHSAEGGRVEVSLTTRGERLFRQANKLWRVAQGEIEAELGPTLSEAVREAARRLRT